MVQTIEERRAYKRNYYKTHPEKWKGKSLQYYYDHHEEQKAKHHAYYLLHRKELRKKQNAYFKLHYDQKHPNQRKKKEPLGNIWWDEHGNPKESKRTI